MQRILIRYMIPNLNIANIRLWFLTYFVHYAFSQERLLSKLSGFVNCIFEQSRQEKV